MAAFPGRVGGSNPLSRNPLNESWVYDIDEITVGAEGMYDYSRPMSTRKRKIFTVTYDLLLDADIDLIVAHFEANVTSESFEWINRAGTSYTVRYVEPIAASFAVEGYQALEPLKFKEI